ncbi:EF-hand domain-containing protein [Colwellia psychrerythraea]|uniref:EF-Hand domain protein n=1 Tax=Colwellia psychrerythraea TaxID=28229 RepID=A0A099K7Z9_COLPS|nr:EF-hand domain-containing protein [Colwellia psychrerythraea]KGJ86486.1 EF-Hand domain protein [Colwellia psychrerythraea]
MSHLTKPALTNKITKTILLTLATTIIISASSLVQAKNTMQSKEPHPRPCFSSIDINGDGEINFDEFSSHKIPHGDHQTVFDSIDTDSDGIISNDEFVNHKPPQRKKRREDRS